MRDTLEFSRKAGTSGLSQLRYVLILGAVYFGIVAVAVLLGLWHNSVTAQEYIELFKTVGSISHPF